MANINISINGNLASKKRQITKYSTAKAAKAANCSVSIAPIPPLNSLPANNKPTSEYNNIPRNATKKRPHTHTWTSTTSEEEIVSHEKVKEKEQRDSGDEKKEVFHDSDQEESVIEEI